MIAEEITNRWLRNFEESDRIWIIGNGQAETNKKDHHSGHARVVGDSRPSLMVYDIVLDVEKFVLEFLLVQRKTKNINWLVITRYVLIGTVRLRVKNDGEPTLAAVDSLELFKL